ncbi:MAG: succinate dehydrogenase, hydrophobic membrane anchor protein [Gammaproteobacteria bacterium]|nr:succinate dehydrogenase, hydrophobic membrane anchor protein [Gammaproteobacteria bacterium]
MTRKVSGFQAWVVQRISAIYLAVYFIYLAGHFMLYPPADYVAWKDWLANPLVSVSLSLFFMSILLHAWIGIRDVVIDYVHPLVTRLLVLAAVAMTLLASGFWILRTLVVVAI